MGESCGKRVRVWKKVVQVIERKEGSGEAEADLRNPFFCRREILAFYYEKEAYER